jgi:diguanylate cyclase (GGDEF)-like protein
VLTGLYNRRHLEEELTRHHRDARRHNDPLCVLLLDIDHFKHVNDTYGHPAGDVVLSAFAHRLRDQLRGGDIAGRWGGEEFLVLLPRTDLAGAMVVAERIRHATGATPVVASGSEITVTVSGGCALGPGGSSEEMIHAVDSRLYAAKAAGRNQIFVATPMASQLGQH